MGISENINGPCHVVNRLNIETGDTITLYEELNEYFDAHGNLIGLTFKQFSSGDYDPGLFEFNSRGEQVLKGGGGFFSESMFYVNVVGEHLYMRAGMRESLIQKGGLDCIARFDGGVAIWD
jgi:hypothetical protein